MRNKVQLNSQYHDNFICILFNYKMYAKINILKVVLIKLFYINYEKKYNEKTIVK